MEKINFTLKVSFNAKKNVEHEKVFFKLDE